LSCISDDENPKQFYDFILPEIKAELNTKTAENNVKGLSPLLALLSWIALIWLLDSLLF